MYASIPLLSPSQVEPALATLPSSTRVHSSCLQWQGMQAASRWTDNPPPRCTWKAVTVISCTCASDPLAGTAGNTKQSSGAVIRPRLGAGIKGTVESMPIKQFGGAAAAHAGGMSAWVGGMDGVKNAAWKVAQKKIQQAQVPMKDGQTAMHRTTTYAEQPSTRFMYVSASSLVYVPRPVQHSNALQLAALTAAGVRL